jgi:hypothetical protein
MANYIFPLYTDWQLFCQNDIQVAASAAYYNYLVEQEAQKTAEMQLSPETSGGSYLIRDKESLSYTTAQAAMTIVLNRYGVAEDSFYQVYNGEGTMNQKFTSSNLLMWYGYVTMQAMTASPSAAPIIRDLYFGYNVETFPTPEGNVGPSGSDCDNFYNWFSVYTGAPYSSAMATVPASAFPNTGFSAFAPLDMYTFFENGPPVTASVSGEPLRLEGTWSPMGLPDSISSAQAFATSLAELTTNIDVVKVNWFFENAPLIAMDKVTWHTFMDVPINSQSVVPKQVLLEMYKVQEFLDKLYNDYKDTYAGWKKWNLLGMYPLEQYPYNPETVDVPTYPPDPDVCPIEWQP